MDIKVSELIAVLQDCPLGARVKVFGVRESTSFAAGIEVYKGTDTVGAFVHISAIEEGLFRYNCEGESKRIGCSVRKSTISDIDSTSPVAD